MATRTLITARRESTAALLGLALNWDQGAEALDAALTEPGLDASAYLAALDACWAAGATILYGRLARRLLLARPAAAPSLCRADLPPLEAVVRLDALFTTADGDEIGPSRGFLERLARDRVRLVPMDQRHKALGLLAALERQPIDPEIGQECARLREGFYAHALAQTYAPETAGATIDSTASHHLIHDQDFRAALRDWTMRKEEDAIRAAAAQDASLREENARLGQELAELHAEVTRLRSSLEEVRILGQATHAEESMAARLPLLKRLTELADETDRLLMAGQGDYDTLIRMRERIHDVLAEQGVHVVGEIGARTRFDAALHEFVGERGAEHEWFQILESGYVILLSAKDMTVLKRIPVRPKTE